MSKSKHKNKKQVRELMSKYMNYIPDYSLNIKVGDTVIINVENILSRKDKFNEKYIEFVKDNVGVPFTVEQNINNAYVYSLIDCLWTFHYSDLILVEEDKNGK